MRAEPLARDDRRLRRYCALRRLARRRALHMVAGEAAAEAMDLGPAADEPASRKTRSATTRCHCLWRDRTRPAVLAPRHERRPRSRALLGAGLRPAA